VLLMLMQGFVFNQGDGWQWTLGALERLGAEHEGDWSFANYNNFAENLGRRLAEMHEVLASPSEDPAFAPEAMSAEQARTLASRVTAQVDRAIDLLSRSSALDESVRAEVASLHKRRDALTERIATIAEGARDCTLTRIHGDLHLGQVLVTGSDVMIIDFEGEPTRSLAERRAKDIPLRDVAGMLRSFDYAGAVAERSRPAAGEAQELRAEAGASQFRENAVSAFLGGYFGEGAQVDPLLDLFVLEKAAYEVAYEAANRPDWLAVPAVGLARSAERILSGEKT
jgi:maltose alpha-D-glucosyltransferase / alpha-amylase